MNTEKKLFLLDAFALIYRGYFAFGKNHRYNSKGLNTSAILGFTNTLIDILHNQKPTHIGVVFDSPAQTIRVEQYSEYKANREAMPEDIRVAIPHIRKVIEAFNIPMLQLDGYEADDVIGTLAQKAEKEGFTTYMMTPDKDFGQLVTPHTFMYRPGRGGKPAEVWGIPEICEKFEIEHPKQVIDILGLWGDAVDNIPGIPGIGEKTAKKLIKQYGSIEELLKNTEDLKGKQKENVINFAEQGMLSKQLATIILDAPIAFDATELTLTDPNKEHIKELFTEYEFRNLAQKVLKEQIVIQPKKTQQIGLFDAPQTQEDEIISHATIENSQHEYVLVDTVEKRKELIKELSKQTAICFDTETTDLNIQKAELVGIAFSYKAHEAFYLPFSEDQLETKEILQELMPIFNQEDTSFIGHNLKYDLQILLNYGINLCENKLFDTMIAHYLLSPELKHNMDFLSELYLGYTPISITTLLGKKGKQQKTMRQITVEEATPYACEDADITFRLYKLFNNKLKENQNLLDLFYNIEMPLMPILANMEYSGITLDVKALEKFSNELQGELHELKEEILQMAGVEFNIDSPKQLGEVLFETLAIVEKPKKTKTGQYSTNEDTLVKIEKKHPIIPSILTYRSLKKLKSTYVDALPLLTDDQKKIHTSYMQTITATGRLSSNNPNIQNIPIRTEKGRAIRKAFIPASSNTTLIAADYSQIELRIIAGMSKDPAMCEAFINNEDIHTATAAKVFHVSPEEVTREMRSQAKAVNFGIIYGVSAFGLSQNIGVSRKEAKSIIDSYFEKYPNVKKFMDDSILFAKENGYVETLLKRKRFLKDINSANAVVRGHAERNAINSPIQGSAADIIKIAMINISSHLSSKQLECKMLLQVHDELVFECPNKEVDTVLPIIQKEMENAIEFEVPLTVSISKGANWLEAH